MSEANSLNLRQSFSSKTTLLGRQCSVIEYLRRNGCGTHEDMAEEMGVCHSLVRKTLASLASRGYVAMRNMTGGEAVEHRQTHKFGTLPQVATLTRQARGLRISFARVDGTGQKLGLCATGVAQLSDD